MDYLLHIDTSTDIGSVAISGDGKLLSQITAEAIRNHAADINLLVSQALKDANILLNDISAVAVCAGPGSYTGLRIALATAKGICYASDKPLIMNNRLSLIALNEDSIDYKNTTKTIASVITARENEYFIGIYNNKHVCISDPQHVLQEQMSELLKEKENLHIISDLSSEMFYQLKVNFTSLSNNITIDYNKWAEYACFQYKCQEFVNLASATPFYLKQVYTHK